MNFHFTQGARAALTIAAMVSMTSAQGGAQQLAGCPPANGQQIDRAVAAGNRNCGQLRNCEIACRRGMKCALPCARPPKDGGGNPPGNGGGNPPGNGRGNPPNDGGQNAPEGGGRYPPRGGGQIQGGDGGSDMFPTIIGVAVAAVAATAAVDEMTGKKWATSEELDRNGPRFPDQQSLGRFQAQGYALPGWPFLVDLETEPGTVTWLEVRYKGADERPRTVDLSNPEGGRRIQLVNLPAAPDSLGIARYSIHSVFVREGQQPTYRPLKIFGIGAGPNAVGSLDASSGTGPIAVHAAFSAWTMPRRSLLQSPGDSARRVGAHFAPAAFAAQSGDFGSYLSVLAFGPKFAASPADVSWAVAAKRRFPRSQLEVLLVPGDGRGKYVSVNRVDIDLLARSEARGSWGALPLRSSIGAGTYELQARAWRTKAEGGDWTGAFAPDYVYLR